MLKPNMPNMPGMGAMTDTLEFVKNFWGSMGIPGTNVPSMNIPGMVMPTLSVDEIRKKISDLKAVESWLELNMNMLRATIQALEVQAATISTLQSMGEAFNATVNAGAANASSPAPQRPQQAPAAEPESAATRNSAEAPGPTSRDEADAASLTAPLVNAAAWWNMLQNQFQQAVSSAIAAESPVPNGADRAQSDAKNRTEPEPEPESEPGAAPARRRRTPK